MGGNVYVYHNKIKTFAQQIPLQLIGRLKFTESVKEILYSINNNLNCWSDDNIEKNEIFNGSSQYVFNQEYSDLEIFNVKRTLGDVDVMIDVEFREPLIRYFDCLNVPVFKGFVYNQNIDQIHSIFKICGYNCQIDFEFVKFSEGKPTEFAKFSHSANLEDAKYKIKAVFHKFLIGAVTYTTSQNILISDYNGNFTNDGKIPKFAVFSIIDGFKIKYKPLYDKSNHKFVTHHGMRVFVKNRNPFSTNVRRFYMYLFNVNTLNNYDKFWSFVGVCDLIKSAFTRDKILEINNKFCEMIENHRVSKDPDEDKKLKYYAYQYFSKVLELNNF